MRSSDDFQSGNAVGVGVMFQQRPDNIVAVKSVIPGGPADRSGNVRVGDMIQRVNGLDVQGRSLAALRGLITGEPGTVVTLGLVREGMDTVIEVPLVRSATGQNGAFLQPESINRSIGGGALVPSSFSNGVTPAAPPPPPSSASLSVSPLLRAVANDDSDRLRHALRQSEAVIKQHEDDLHNMRLMLDRQRRDSDTRVMTLEEQIRRLEADRYRLEQEKRKLQETCRDYEIRMGDVENLNLEMRSRQGQLSEELNVMLNKESMAAKLIEEMRVRQEDERREMELITARLDAELRAERNRRAESESVIAQLSDELRRLRDDERIRKEREIGWRERLEGERRRIDDILKYSGQVAQILSSVDPRLEGLERDIFAASASGSTSATSFLPPSISSIHSVLARPPASVAAAAAPTSASVTASPPRDEAYFIA